MARITADSSDPGEIFVSLSLKPKLKWDSLVAAVINFAMVLGGIVTLAIQLATYFMESRLHAANVISEAPAFEIDWILIILIVLTACTGINYTAGAKKYVWLTKNINKDINTKDVVILKPIPKSDLIPSESTGDRV